MPYAIRYDGPAAPGMLVEESSRTLTAIKKVQDAADEAREAYWDADGGPQGEEPPATFPYYEIIPAYQAHNWVRSGFRHNTLLYTVDGGTIRRTREG